MDESDDPAPLDRILTSERARISDPRVRELADRIIVLHNGQLVADGEPAAVIASPIVQQAYLGLAPEAEPA